MGTSNVPFGRLIEINELFGLCVDPSLAMLGCVAVEELPGVRARAARTVGFRWLILATATAWAIVATMHYWWAWLWTRLGVLSVPVDMVAWIVAIVLTILLAPVLWHRFHKVWVVGFVVGVLCLGGTVAVLSPWHDVLAKAWLSTQCGVSGCISPELPVSYSRRSAGP